LRREVVLIALAIGVLLGFIDSYSYAITGFTTAELSILVVPLLMLAAAEALGIRIAEEELLLGSALAIGMDLTTTLTSGMYITYGFLDYLSERLSSFGLEVSVPRALFAWSPHLIDLEAMPTYLSLSLVSAGGALVAYALRRHFFDMEKLPFPLGMTAALLVTTLRRVFSRGVLVAAVLGMALQLLFIALGEAALLDLTPVAQLAVPGMVVAVSFNAMTLFLALLLPKGSLYAVSLGSLVTYLGLIPLAAALGYAVFTPMPSYEDALFTASPVVSSAVVGFIAVAAIIYMLHYRKAYARTLYVVSRIGLERRSLLMGLALVWSMALVLLSISRPATTSLAIAALLIVVLLLHPLLTVVNLRIVGEVGFSSQAILPMATAVLYASGVRDIAAYAAVDPFTGIPMPQVVGGVAMNTLRSARLLGSSPSRTTAMLIAGIVVGAPLTYVYGNMLVKVYGFDSSVMPLTKWIPTVVWMASIYSGSAAAIVPQMLLIGAVIGGGMGAAMLLGKGLISPFAFVLGMTVPPDVAFTFLAAAVVKSVVLRMGVDLHERLLLYSTSALIGSGIAVLGYTLVLAAMGG